MPEGRLQKTRELYRQLNAGDNPAGQALADIADFNDQMWRNFDKPVVKDPDEPTAETPWAV